MNDLLQSQIKGSCELALPNGLKELMWDISREVLRAQPQDIYDFITNYLSVLLVTRENLSVAAKVCDKTCRAPCHVALQDKLRDIGLCEEDVERTKEIIMDHFGRKAKVNERNLLLKLMKNTEIDEDLLPAIQDAVRSAFVEQHVYKTNIDEPSANLDDEVKQAAKHTLDLYKNTNPTNEEYNQMATKIQAAYRAYGVKRTMCTNKLKETERKEKTLRMKDDIHVEINLPEKSMSPRANNRSSVITESSTSLAGSYVKLPKYTPYSAHDVHDYEEVLEMVHSSSEFGEENVCLTRNIRFHDKSQEVDKKISYEALTIEDDVLEADDESEGTIEESIHVESDDNIESNMDKIYEMDENGLNEIDIMTERHEMDALNEIVGENNIYDIAEEIETDVDIEFDELTEQNGVTDIYEMIEVNDTHHYKMKLSN